MSDNGKQQLIFQPEDAQHPVIAAALWATEDTRRRTLAALKDINLLVIDHNVSEQTNTIGTLLYHIGAIELDWLYSDVMELGFPQEMASRFEYDVRDANGRLTVVAGKPLDEHLELLSVVRAELLGCFREMSLDDYRRPRHLEHYDVTPEWVLHHLMQHEAEHRGEMLTLRAEAERMLGL